MSRKAHGQIRRAQVITTYGPGALIDLPRHSAIVGGLGPRLGTAAQPVLVQAPVALLRDEYPPFGDEPYPVEVDIPVPLAPRDRLGVAFRPILAIPHLLAIWALGVAWGITTIIAKIAESAKRNRMWSIASRFVMCRNPSWPWSSIRGDASSVTRSATI